VHAHKRQAYQEHPSKREIGGAACLMALRKNGEAFPVEITLNVIRTARRTWIAADIRDLTERKLAEERLIAERRRAEEASRTKSAFLAAMSHEIRTPMNSILGMADLLWETQLTAEQRQYVEVFRRAGANLLTLIDDILDFSKIESGRLALERVEFDLEELVDQVVELVGLKARSKNLALVSRFLPGTVTSLVGDPTRLRQILINLTGNAVKFTHSGEVLLTVENAESGRPGEIAFAVSDTGIGIPADKLNSIFDQFTQADNSITREYGGTGLGLAISQRLVESMAGKLTVSSKLGEGSTFSFTAQFDLGRVKAKQEARDLEDLHGRRVLIVDDNPANCLILREALKAWGLDAHSFEQFDEAFADIDRATRSGEEYTLVILDRQMPQADGFQAAEKIWSVAPRLPIVLLSSAAASGDFTRAIKAGFAGYAVKPVQRADLFRLVCQAMKAAPRRTTLAAGLPVPRPVTRQTAGLKILIVEDSEDNRLLIDRYLKESPYQITFATDGLQGVEEFNRGSFDLILMDLQMPRMDGLTATRTIRKMEAEQNLAATPIVALSANARPQDIALSRKLGCNDHLSKPISKARLLAAIQEHSREGAISGAAPQSESVPAPTPSHQLPVDADAMNYLARRKSELESLRSLLAALEFDRIRIAGHNMKGSGGGYGFPKLTELGAAIESAAKLKDPGALDRKLSDLGLYLAEVLRNSPETAAIH
jgi:signal transduction histidine kinase/DNA-binding response OmpR family regulator